MKSIYDLRKGAQQSLRVATVVLALAFTTTANAQLGNLLNKAKEAIKNEAKEAVKKEAKETANRAAEKAGLKSVDLTNLYKHDFSPSKEALKEDPDANSDKVQAGFSRPYKQVHAAYEHLDPQYFPLQPYYKYPNIYCLGEGRQDYPYIHYLELMYRFLATPPGSDLSGVVTLIGYNENNNKELISADGQKLALNKDDMFRYPFAARFFADPNSKQAPWNLAFLLANESPRVRLVREYAVANKAGVADAQKGWVFPYTNESAQSRREAMMVEMARSVTDITYVAESVLQLYQQIEGEKEAYKKTVYMLAANELYKKVLTQHHDYSVNANKLTQLQAYYQRYSEGPEYIKIIDDAIVMPEPEQMTLTPGAMHKQLSAQVLALAKKQDPSVIRVVVINDSWQVHYNGNVPTDRAVMAWAVYKDKKTGKLTAHDYSFCEDYQGGGKYGKLRYKGIGMRTVLVK